MPCGAPDTCHALQQRRRWQNRPIFFSIWAFVRDSSALVGLGIHHTTRSSAALHPAPSRPVASISPQTEQIQEPDNSS